MLTQPCSRRRFVLSTSSLMMTALAVPGAFRWPDKRTSFMFVSPLLVSAERASHSALPPQTLLFEGPRIARLQRMADRLPKLVGDIVLRLDATDDQLLDIAAQTAGVGIERRGGLPLDLGVRARVIPQQRTFA